MSTDIFIPIQVRRFWILILPVFSNVYGSNVVNSAPDQFFVSSTFHLRLGLLSDVPAPLCGSPIDTLCAHLQDRLQYQPGERDAVFMRESFTIEWPNRTKVSEPQHCWI